MLKVLLLPILAVIGGLGGFFLRRLELATIFDTSGLAAIGAPVSIALIVLSIILALVIALLCRNPKSELKDYAAAFSVSGNWIYLIVIAVAAACLLVAGTAFLYGTLLWGQSNVLRTLLGAMCILSFFCVLIIALSNFRAKSRKFSLALLAPAYTFCFWLVTAYQQRASDPVILDYVYELFAIICTLLGLYFTAGFSFGRGKTWRCAFFCLMSVYFSIITLADSHDLSARLLFIFSILYHLATAVVLLHHAFVALPKHLLDNSNKTQEVIPDE